MKYRPEIDGLRAVAVLPVILFHGGFAGFDGGFLGVDVFFVLSGYLITSIICEELARDQFTIVKFYERRARRILPALFLVVAACVPMAWFWLVPGDMREFSQSAISVVGFVSNVYFWQQSGYFSTAAELKPLLHTWSLGIEEQFYVLFPLVMMVLWRLDRKWLPRVLFAGFLASLLMAQWLAVERPSAAFFLIPTRAWELLLGSLAAIHLRGRTTQPSRRLRESGCFIGLGMLVGSFATFDDSFAVPGFVTLVPTVGTALLVLFADPSTTIGRVLGTRALVGIGLVSYSAYLWHQPLFAFARHALPGRPSQVFLLALAVLSLLLAYVTWRLVETPFRNRTAVSRRLLVRGAVAASLIVLSFGVVGAATEGFRDLKVDAQERHVLATATPSPMRSACHYRDENRHPDEPCEYFHSPAHWAVLGDSHAVELSYALAQGLDPKGVGVRHYSRSACGPEFGDFGTHGACQQWTEQSVRELIGRGDVSTVVMSYRINSYLFGDHELTYPDIPDKRTDQQRQRYLSALTAISRELLESGKQVVFVLQAPELPKRIENLALVAGISATGDVEGVSRTWWTRRSRFLRSRLSTLPPDLAIVDPAGSFCDPRRCFAAMDGISLYFDDDHMSVAGAGILVPEIIRQARVASAAHDAGSVTSPDPASSSSR